VRSYPALAALAAAALTAGIEALYIWLLWSEGEGELGMTVPRAIIGFLTAASLALAVGAFLRGRAQPVVLGAAAVGLLALAIPAMLSIGAMLFVTGLLALHAASSSRHRDADRVAFSRRTEGRK
jgi:hypothetical protein